MTGRRVLIVNADDFGLTPGVCDAILRAGEHGIVSSTSALVTAPAFRSNAGALSGSGLGVGGHLCMVGEDPPVLAAREIPTLVVAGGGFRLSWRQVVRDGMLGRIDPDDVRREFAAQIEVMVAAGLRVTHLDSHQNVHLWPMVAGVLIGLASQHGIGAMRMPRSSARSPTSIGVRSLAAGLARRADRAGLRFPEASAGLDEAGSLDVAALRRTVAAFGRSGAVSAELATHPGLPIDPDRDRYRWGYAWAQELDALCDPAARQAVESAGFDLGTFADLANPLSARAASRRVLAGYRGQGLQSIAHTHLRWNSAPFEAVEALIPEHGEILDVGCGHGTFSLYLAARSDRRSVRGVDIDGAKIASARAAAARLGLAERATFEVVDAEWVPDPATADSVVVNDVLYLLGRSRAERLLGALVRACRAGGAIVVKEVDDSPGWKARIGATQEYLATRVFGVTEGSTIEFVSGETIERCLRAEGFAVTTTRLDRGYPHAHAVWVGRRPETTEEAP